MKPFEIVAVTANVLGSLNNPFEFYGEHNCTVDRIQRKVFSLLVSKEALSKTPLGLVLIPPEKREEEKFGPMLSELAAGLVHSELSKKLSSHFSSEDLDQMKKFIDRFKDKKVFCFFRNHPKGLMSLDKTLRDQASANGNPFNLPIIGSTAILEGNDVTELKRKLLDDLFTEEILRLSKNKIMELEEVIDSYKQPIFLNGAETKDLQVFRTAAGRVFFHWLYESLNLHLIAEKNLIHEVNYVKNYFNELWGWNRYEEREKRAKLLMKKLEGVDVLFTQESDATIRDYLVQSGFFSVKDQNQKDGTFVFLRKECWSGVVVLPIEGSYKRYEEGKLNVLFATHRSGEKFLLASCHGLSTDSKDAGEQIQEVMKVFHKTGNRALQLLIGIDANTKSKEEVSQFRKFLKANKLVATENAYTTRKLRMVTVQHAKAGEFAEHEEDFLITLDVMGGGKYQLEKQRSECIPSKKELLPNRENLSDHYPVKAKLARVGLHTTSLGKLACYKI